MRVMRAKNGDVIIEMASKEDRHFVDELVDTDGKGYTSFAHIPYAKYLAMVLMGIGAMHNEDIDMLCDAFCEELAARERGAVRR